jgi:hypothetical protein
MLSKRQRPRSLYEVLSEPASPSDGVGLRTRMTTSTETMDPDQEHLGSYDFAGRDHRPVRTTITKAHEPVDPDQQLADLLTHTPAATPPAGDGRTRVTRAKEEIDPDRTLTELTGL